MKNIFIFMFVVLLVSSCGENVGRIDLAGKWTVRLDSADVGIQENWPGRCYETAIMLPGTTDMAKLGTKTMLKPALEKPQLLHLTRAYSYVGPAWYAREVEIPAEWKEKDCFLHLERVLWDTQVWVDGIKVDGHEESLVSPHCYNLTSYLQSGEKHLLTVRVDNRKRYDISVNDLAHAYTNATQVMWNGILGDMYIEAVDKVRVDDVQIYPDVASRSAKVAVTVCNSEDVQQEAMLELLVLGEKDGKEYGIANKKISVGPGKTLVELECTLDKDAPLWSEFTPNLYCANVELKSEKGTSCVSERFGLRQIAQAGSCLMLNDRLIFLRGTLECCIFPLTGTPPTDEEAWRELYSSAREYGLNHLRFHSWCPPEAAFNVADEMGFYLQVELPVWSVTLGSDSATIDFLRAEASRIRKEYGNHPSFCFWSLGNELQYDFQIMASLLQEMKKADGRHLYTTTSFTFEKGHGDWPEPDDDFFVTQWTRKGWVRGQGVFNEETPSFEKDYHSSVEGMQVPLVTHEVGQYSVYPDLTEIPKYTGTLIPLNFMAVKQDLERKGLIEKAPQYLQASGKLAAILYKEEIERALKTSGVSGFQLLDLHDFPGQGTALVGLLNAFWESKGIIQGREFREFCAPVVPLLRFPKAVYTNNEFFVAKAELSNYGVEELKDRTLVWEVKDAGKSVGKGRIDVADLRMGHNENLGEIVLPLNSITKASKLEVCLSLENSEYRNCWNIWVYPLEIELNWGDVKYTRDYNTAMQWLVEGKKVLFNPDWHTLRGIEGKFVPVFWSPVHFPNQAGTMGVLCNPSHPALSDFPTDMHTDWQWWDLNINSTTMIVDSLNGGSPIVEMVDNFVNNRRLASLYEGGVGKGKLMLATFDLQTALDKRPVARQMLASILKYMNSAAFAPSRMEGLDKMKDVFGTANNQKQSAKGIY